MFRRYLKWRNIGVLIGMVMIILGLLYVNQLVEEMEVQERAKVDLTIDGIRAISDVNNNNQDQTFATNVVMQNHTIPMIMTDEKGNITSYNNIDSVKIEKNPNYLNLKLEEFKALHEPITADFFYGKSYIYYGNSDLLIKLRYYPLFILSITVVFLGIMALVIYHAQRSLQNQVWVGMSKETAHQMGTPLSSIVGWMEVLRTNEENVEMIDEMEKDVSRLKLVADRFSKIGSVPQLQEEDLVVHLENMVEYMQKRSPKNVKITLHKDIGDEDEVNILLSGPLFDWVIENLIRNALDAMEGKGNIDIFLKNEPRQVFIDIKDTGKGIPKSSFKKVFQPGYSTKQRGWGLGLSLAKRIIHNYHHGTIAVKCSEIGVGTTFRIHFIR